MPGVQIDVNAKNNASGVFDQVEQKGKGVFGRIGDSARNALGGGGSTRVGAGVGGFSITGSLAGIAGGFTGVGIAAVATGKALWSATEPARNFEKTMSQVEAIIQPTTEQLTAMESEAKRLGATTSFTATQSAEAYVKLGQAGLSASESLGALEPTLNAAAAGGISLSSAADIGTNIMAGMGLEVSDLNHVMDGLARASTSTNTDIRELGKAFQYGGAVAKTSGLSFDETTAALGALADSGLKGSSAGTALSNALIKMQKPSEKAKDIMAAANLEFKNVDGTLKPLPEIVDNVGRAGLNTAELIELFGQRGVRAMVALDEKGGGELRALTDSIRDSDGAAKDMAETMLDNVEGSVTKFQSAIEGLQIALAEGLLPHLKTFIDWITSGVSSVTSFIEEMKKADAEGGPLPRWANQLIALKDLGVLLFEFLVSGVKTFLGAINTLVAPLDALVSWAVTGEGSLKGVWNAATTAANELKDTVVANNLAIDEDVKTLKASVTKVYTDEKEMRIKASNDAIDASIAKNEEFLRKMGITESGGISDSGVMPGLKKGTEKVQEDITLKVKEEIGNRAEVERLGIIAAEFRREQEVTAFVENRKKMLTAHISAYDEMVGDTEASHDEIVADLDLTGTEMELSWGETNVELERISGEGGKGSQKTFQEKFNEDLRTDFKAGVKVGLGNLMAGDLGGFFKGIGASMLGSITGKMSDDIAGAFTNTVFGGESGAGLMGVFKGKGSLFGGGMLKSVGGVFGGTGGAAGGLVGVLGTAVPVAGLALIGLNYGKQIWAGMKKAFSAIGGFFKNVFGGIGGAIGGIFGAGKKATIESAWDPRILKVLIDQGFKAGDKVSKEHAKNIAMQVGAGPGLKDGFSFRDLKGDEERRDRMRTNQELLAASIREAERAGVVLSQAQKDMILGVKTAELQVVDEVAEYEKQLQAQLAQSQTEAQEAQYQAEQVATEEVKEEQKEAVEAVKQAQIKAAEEIKVQQNANILDVFGSMTTEAAQYLLASSDNMNAASRSMLEQWLAQNLSVSNNVEEVQKESVGTVEEVQKESVETVEEVQKQAAEEVKEEQKEAIGEVKEVWEKAAESVVEAATCNQEVLARAIGDTRSAAEAITGVVKEVAGNGGASSMGATSSMSRQMADPDLLARAVALSGQYSQESAALYRAVATSEERAERLGGRVSADLFLEAVTKLEALEQERNEAIRLANESGGNTIIIQGQDSESAQQLAEKVVEEIRKKSYQGEQVVYDTGVVNTGAAA